MAKVEKSITINAPVEKVFAYIEDPMNQLEYLPSIVEVKDVTARESERTTAGPTRWPDCALKGRLR